MSSDIYDGQLPVSAVETDKPQRAPQKPPNPQVLLLIARTLATKPAWWDGRPMPLDRATRREFMALMRKAAKASKRAGRGKRGGQA